MTITTAGRILRQLRHDHRTVAMIMLVPVLLVTLLRYMFNGQPQLFGQIAPIMLGIFPLIMMFLVTSITTLRERTSGTLDRLMTLPISKGDFVFGYALAFSLVGYAQAGFASLFILGVFDVAVVAGMLPILIAAAGAAFLGTALGLFVSAFARNEFQAVQLVMPIIMPQVLLSGLFVAREQMARPLELLSAILPLTYSVDAMKQAVRTTAWSDQYVRDVLVVLACGLVALVLGAVTIRRQE